MHFPAHRISAQVSVRSRVANSTRRVRGFTLMELMIGMFVFTLLALGVTAGVLQSRRLAQLNVLRNTAWTVAQGYMEQIMSINPADIEAASEPWVTNRPPLPTEAVNALLTNTTAIEVSDPLYTSPRATAPTGTNMTARTDVPGDMWNVRQIMVDLNTNSSGVSTPVTMNMWLDVNISRAWTQLNGVWQVPTTPYMLIKIDFQFQSNGYLAVGKLGGTLRMARTDIPGF